jgi:hypothetical protein
MQHDVVSREDLERELRAIEVLAPGQLEGVYPRRALKHGDGPWGRRVKPGSAARTQAKALELASVEHSGLPHSQRARVTEAAISALLLAGCNANQGVNVSSQTAPGLVAGPDYNPYNPISYAQNNTGIGR